MTKNNEVIAAKPFQTVATPGAWPSRIDARRQYMLLVKEAFAGIPEVDGRNQFLRPQSGFFVTTEWFRNHDDIWRVTDHLHMLRSIKISYCYRALSVCYIRILYRIINLSPDLVAPSFQFTRPQTPLKKFEG